MKRVWDAQRQREAQVDEECRTTRSAFDAARALRKKEVLDLRKTLELNDERTRERLRDRVLQQCDRHNLLAQKGIQACMRFAEIVLSGEIEIGRNVLARVRSQVVVAENRDGGVDSEISDFAHTPLSARVQEALNREDIRVSLFPWSQGPSTVGGTIKASAQVREYAPIPSPPWPNSPPSDGKPARPSAIRDVQPFDAGLIGDLEGHFEDVEKERERTWRRLQEQLDADLDLWRERHQALLASLASAFASEGQPESGNAFKAADELDHAWAGKTFWFAERWRVRDMRHRWKQTKAAFALHHDAFVERLRAAERGLDSNDYSPQPLVPITPRGAAVWSSTDLPCPGLRTLSLPQYPMFVPPLSLTNLLRVPRASRALPTASPHLQMRTAFRDAQAQRDRRFEATLAAFEVESQAAERKREVALATELRSWRNQADTAEHERAALFSRRIQAAREEWDVYRVRRDRDADDLVQEFEERFSHTQTVREADFMAGVQKLHDHFTSMVQELLSL